MMPSCALLQVSGLSWSEQGATFVAVASESRLALPPIRAITLAQIPRSVTVTLILRIAETLPFPLSSSRWGKDLTTACVRQQCLSLRHASARKPRGCVERASPPSQCPKVTPQLLSTPVSRPTLTSHDLARSVAFSPEGLFPGGPVLATGSDDQQVGFLTEGAASKRAKHTDSVTALAWHPTQRKLASVGYDRNLLLWSCDEQGVPQLEEGA
jgi:hypothetical protein